MWKIQFGIGVIMLIYYGMISYVIRNMETGFSQGVLVGFGGLLLVWGMREVLGALSKQYKIKKNAISRVGER